MKFFRFMFLTALVILSISAMTIIIGVFYAYQFNDDENNLYYSELSYRLIEKQIEHRMEMAADHLFYSNDAIDLRNSITLSLVNQLDDSAFKTKMMNIATAETMTGYYYELGGEDHINRVVGSYERAVIDRALGAFRDDLTENVQMDIVKVESQDYLVFINQYHNYTDNASHFIVYYTPFENFANTSILNDLTNGNGFLNIEIILDSAISGNAVSFKDGYIDITQDDYNVVYMPVTEVSDHWIMAVYMDKPRIISAINHKINMIIMTILAGFSLFTFIFLFLSKKVSKNLDDVVGQVDHIANGHYTNKINLKGIYELEQLSNSINQMGDTIDAKISELSKKNAEMLRLMIEALDANDTYTKGHSERVAKLARKLGEAVGYEDMDQLISAALLHDIGKITVPENILNKPGKLEKEEFEMIKQHTVVGKRILSQSSAFDNIDDLVLYHHERIDGKGYPEGLTGEKIPFGAKLIAICDVYDALTTARPYRGAMTHEAAMAIIIEGRGKQFSEKVVNAFMTLDIRSI